MSGGSGFGITINGFVTPQLTDIQTDINNALRAKFGADINLAAEGFFGQISGIISERLYLVWQAMQDVYNSQVPDSASGASLDNVGALRGIPRLKAAASVVKNVRLFGDSGTLVPAGTQFSVQGSPTSVFGLDGATTLLAGQSCIQTLLFSAAPVSGTWTLGINGSSTPALAYNITAAALQSAIRTMNFCSGCIVTGSVGAGFTVTFAGAGTGGFMLQPQFVSTSTLLDGGSVHVSVATAITLAGIDQAVVSVTCTKTGPIIANAGTLTNIVTPVSGLTAVLNIEDAISGRNVETDTAYRARMNTELQIAAASTIEAIRARLLAVSGVTSVLVYENPTDAVDGHGRPPHSVEAVVSGGSDADVANTLWQAKAGGINTFGTTSYTITDSQGMTHVMNFSRPTSVPIYIIANLTKGVGYPATGDTLVKELFANYINGLGQGVSVIVDPYLIAQLASIPGILDAVVLVGTSPGPTLPNNITIAAYQQAVSQTSFVTVNTV